MNKPLSKPILAAARGEKPSRYPIWFLRQAGRYLPEYQHIRSQMSFLELCRNPAKAAEVTVQPLRRFDLDGAIIFSDILVPPTAMGIDLSFDKGHGPVLNPVVRSAKDLLSLRMPDAERELGYVGEAIALTKAQLGPTQTMIGFAGAPFTVASYMIEGSGSKNYTEVKTLAFTKPKVFAELLSMLAEVTKDYLKMQVKAGAEIVMLFDSWAGNLAAEDYRSLVAPVMIELFQSLKASLPVPVIYFPGQGSTNLPELSGMAMDVVAVDWRCRIDQAYSMLKNEGLDVSVQGNLDPQILLGDKAFVRTRVHNILDSVVRAQPRGHILNVGHGLLPHTSIDALGWAIEAVRGYP
jgi:uroporphyrinogen decarboxylase